MSGVLGQAVAAALRSVGSALPELVHVMTADDVSAEVVLSSSVDHGLDAASSSGANETRRFVAKVSDFPSLALESLVEVDSVPYLITSLKSTGGAAWFIGLSDEMSSTQAVVRGTRRIHGAIRGIVLSVPALVCRGTEDGVNDGLYAHSASDTFYVVIRDKDWTETSDPDTGDKLSFTFDGVETEVAVVKAERHKGYFLITSRGR